MKSDFIITIPGTKQPLRLSADDIIYVLRVRRKSLTWLATAIGEKRTTVSMNLHGHRHSLAVRKKIHDAIATELAQIPEPQRKALLSAA